jgi:hypothetical protein
MQKEIISHLNAVHKAELIMRDMARKDKNESIYMMHGDRAIMVAEIITYIENNYASTAPHEKTLTDLLAEAGSLLNAIRARDGTAYHNQRYTGGFQTEYMQEEQFNSLVERIREALGGDILKATWNIGKNV